MLIEPMPSPKGTNNGKMFILKGGRMWRGSLSGGAYDQKSDDLLNSDPVAEIVKWVNENLAPEDQTRLIERLAMKPAQDDDPSLDPTQTRRTAPGQAKAMDAMIVRALGERFPGFDKIDVAAMETGRRKPAIASDSAHLKSLAERFPGIDRIGFA